MIQLSTHIKTIIILVAASGFGELLLPKGNMKQYVRFVAGLLITASLAAPLTGWRELPSLSLPEAPPGSYSSELGDRQIREVYISQLQEHIKHKFQIDWVEITADDQLQITDVRTPNPQVTAAVKQYLGL